MLNFSITFIKKLFNKFKNMNIRSQLIFTFIPISLISLIVFASISHYIMSNTLSRNSTSFVNETIKLLSNNIIEKLDEYEKLSSDIVLDYDLYQLLSEDGNDLEYFSKFEVVKQKLAYLTKNFQDIRSVLIYPLDQPLIIKSNTNINFNDLNYKNTELFKKTILDSTKKIWSLDALGEYNRFDGNYLFLLRSIPNINSSSGVLQMQILEDSIFRIYKTISFSKDSTIFITDEYGTIISHPDKNRISNKADTALIKMVNGQAGSFTISLEKQKYLVTYRTINLTSWKLIATIPMSFIESENKRLFYIDLILILSSSIFIVSILVLISSGIAKPLKKLGKAMESVERGDFEFRLDLNSNNEVGKISRKFNSMVSEIKNLMKIVRTEEREKKEAYIQALQAQIKPHFLYNTLFSIKCLASIKNETQIEELLGSLINLLMASINKGGELVEVNQEIEYVKNFVLIQSYRFGDKFKMVYDIEPEINNYIILKLLIQPIVENSIIHGIESCNGEFIVKVTGRVDGNDIIIRIKDNGKGMDNSTLEALFYYKKEEYKNVFSGIGIKNVDERIKLHFGENYGLDYVSKLNEGTEAIIRLPIIKDKGSMIEYV